jgi:hypothetical protein
MKIGTVKTVGTAEPLVKAEKKNIPFGQRKLAAENRRHDIARSRSFPNDLGNYERRER